MHKYGHIILHFSTLFFIITNYRMAYRVLVIFGRCLQTYLMGICNRKWWDVFRCETTTTTTTVTVTAATRTATTEKAIKTTPTRLPTITIKNFNNRYKQQHSDRTFQLQATIYSIYVIYQTKVLTGKTFHDVLTVVTETEGRRPFIQEVG